MREIIQFVALEDLTSSEFLDKLAEAVAQKIQDKAEKSSTAVLKDAEVAKILRKSVSTVRKWKRDKKIPTVRIGGVSVVRKCDLLEVKE